MDQGSKLATAFSELVEFLERNPELLDLQLEIEQGLAVVGDNSEDRLMHLMKLIQMKLNEELLPSLDLLQDILEDSRKMVIQKSKMLG